jgi:diphthamide synthase subunit DPH2
MKFPGHHVLRQLGLDGLPECLGFAPALDKYFDSAIAAGCPRPTYRYHRVTPAVLTNHGLNLAKFNPVAEDLNLRIDTS